jgi:uncharacterized protein YqgC (DUF456 family)
MDFSGAALEIFCGIAIVLGIFGTIIPNIPGLLLSWAGVVLWAIFTDAGSAAKWWVVGIATVLALFATVMKYVLPARHMAREGVPGLVLFFGTVVGIIGFFVVPIVGLFLGFVLGVFVAELLRLKDISRAWPSTWKAIKAVGFSMIIEIFAGLLILASWGAAVLFG